MAIIPWKTSSIVSSTDSRTMCLPPRITLPVARLLKFGTFKKSSMRCPTCFLKEVSANCCLKTSSVMFNSFNSWFLVSLLRPFSKIRSVPPGITDIKVLVIAEPNMPVGRANVLAKLWASSRAYPSSNKRSL